MKVGDATMLRAFAKRLGLWFDQAYGELHIDEPFKAEAPR